MQIAIAQDGYAFFGVGPNLNAAIQDAREWVDRDTELDADTLPRDSSGRVNHGDFCWTTVSDELAKEIKTDGRAAYHNCIETNYGWTVTP